MLINLKSVGSRRASKFFVPIDEWFVISNLVRPLEVFYFYFFCLSVVKIFHTKSLSTNNGTYSVTDGSFDEGCLRSTVTIASMEWRYCPVPGDLIYSPFLIINYFRVFPYLLSKVKLWIRRFWTMLVYLTIFHSII